MKKFILPFLFIPSLVFGQLKETDKAVIGVTNILKNPGFEQGLAQWSASGGVLSQITAGANLGIGFGSGSWDASANGQTLTSSLVAIPKLMLSSKVCAASIFYKGGDSNLAFQVINQSASVIAGPLSLSTQSSWSLAQLSFTCPSSGSLSIQITASADAAAVFLDNGFVGLSISSEYFPILAPDGSASVPSYANSDGRTGLYFSGEAVLVSANQTKVAQIDGTSLNYLFNSITLGSGGTSEVAITNNATNTGTLALSGNSTSSNGAVIRLYGSSHASKANRIEINTNNITRMGIASGNITLGSGGAGTASVLVQADGSTALSGQSNATTYYDQTSVPSSAAGNVGISFYSDITTQASAFSLDQLIGFYFHNRAKGSGSTISKDVAFGGAMPTQGTNNAFLTDSPNSFSGNYGILIAGSSQNKLTGPTTIGSTTTNDDASAGQVGYYVSSSPGVTAAGTSNTWTNYTSISLEAGDYDVNGCVQIDGNGATIATTNYHALAISINSGTTTSDQVKGDNELGIAAQGTSGAMRGNCISGYRIKLAGTTTVYLKDIVVYSVATPNIYGRISARHPR